MRQYFNGIVRLTRYREYLWFVVITTCLGAIAAYGAFGWKLALVLLANELAVGFAFMINDVEDAADDALDPIKAKRNPVSAGILPARVAYVASFAVAGLAAALFTLLGRWPLIVGSACLLIAFLYSWRPVRLKAIPFVDLGSHALMLAGLQFAAGYLAFTGDLGPRFIWPIALVMSFSIYGELFNELRDLEGDLKAGVNHTASVLGAETARQVALAFVLFGFFAAIVSFLAVQLVPIWVLGLSAVTALLLLARPALRHQRGRSFVASQAPFQKPVEIAAAVALAVRMMGPWLNTLANTVGHSSFGVSVMSSPWVQQLMRLWQMQSEQLLRMF